MPLWRSDCATSLTLLPEWVAGTYQMTADIVMTAAAMNQGRTGSRVLFLLRTVTARIDAKRHSRTVMYVVE